MSFVHDLLDRGQPFEKLVLQILHSLSIPAGLNPHTDTRKAWFDVWMYGPDAIWLECKADWMSRKTGNICVELEALNHSRAPLFIYGFPYAARKVYIHAFYREELQRLCSLTKTSTAGRIYAYRHLQIGDQQNNIGVLVPKTELNNYGRPFGQAIRELKQTN